MCHKLLSFHFPTAAKLTKSEYKETIFIKYVYLYKLVQSKLTIKSRKTQAFLFLSVHHTVSLNRHEHKTLSVKSN